MVIGLDIFSIFFYVILYSYEINVCCFLAIDFASYILSILFIYLYELPWWSFPFLIFNIYHPDQSFFLLVLLLQLLILVLKFIYLPKSKSTQSIWFKIFSRIVMIHLHLAI